MSMHEQQGASVRELMAENAALRRQLASLIDQAESNHAIMMRHQAFDLDIVGAGSFQELVATIFRQLPVVSNLDIVTLSLVDTGADIFTVMHKLGVDFDALPNLLFHEHPEELGFELDAGRIPRPLLLPYHPVSHAMAFPSPPSGLASVALVPLLRNRRLIGSLNLGSRDPSRFTPLLGTDFVQHMGSIVAICLENVISNEMLKYIGLTDALTGVYNRRYMDRRLVEEVARARRQAYRVSCMYIDVDHFKQVNDTYGHQAGDDVLREVASRIKAELRMSDALGRFGGEEFVVLLIDADLESAGVVAQRIRASVANQLFLLAEGQGLSVSVSIGVAMLDETVSGLPIEEAAQALVAQADGALYEAKQQGRNRVVAST
jgi:two-component system cell cycle response regulator